MEYEGDCDTYNRLSISDDPGDKTGRAGYPRND